MLALLVSLLAYAPTAAPSATPPAAPDIPYARTDQWEFYRNPENGVCSMKGYTANGVAIMISRSSQWPKTTLMMFRQGSWESLTPGKYYRAQLQSAATMIEPGPGIGLQGKLGVWLALGVDTNTLVRAAERGERMLLTYEDRMLTMFDLDPSTQNQMREIDRCAGLHDDPFSGK